LLLFLICEVPLSRTILIYPIRYTTGASLILQPSLTFILSLRCIALCCIAPCGLDICNNALLHVALLCAALISVVLLSAALISVVLLYLCCIDLCCIVLCFFQGRIPPTSLQPITTQNNRPLFPSFLTSPLKYLANASSRLLPSIHRTNRSSTTSSFSASIFQSTRDPPLSPILPTLITNFLD